MKTLPLRSTGPRAAEPDEFDFPIPVADPSVRPMHRQCVLKGCAYRSRFLFGVGWVLAALFFVTTLTMGLYSARSSQEALLKENAFLSQQIATQGEQSVTRSRPPVPIKQELVTPPPPSKAAPQARKSVPPKKSKEYPPVTESVTRGVTPASRLPESDGFLLSIRPADQKE